MKSKINETVLARFHQLQNLTLNSILHHYTQISLSKIAKMLKISESEVSKQIESFNNISTGCAAWDRTIMEPLLGQTHKIYVEVTDGLVKLDTD
jgi:predicted phosphohydrolase